MCYIKTSHVVKDFLQRKRNWAFALLCFFIMYCIKVTWKLGLKTKGRDIPSVRELESMSSCVYLTAYESLNYNMHASKILQVWEHMSKRCLWVREEGACTCKWAFVGGMWGVWKGWAGRFLPVKSWQFCKAELSHESSWYTRFVPPAKLEETSLMLLIALASLSLPSNAPAFSKNTQNKKTLELYLNKTKHSTSWVSFIHHRGTEEGTSLIKKKKSFVGHSFKSPSWQHFHLLFMPHWVISVYEAAPEASENDRAMSKWGWSYQNFFELALKSLCKSGCRHTRRCYCFYYGNRKRHKK